MVSPNSAHIHMWLGVAVTVFSAVFTWLLGSCTHCVPSPTLTLLNQRVGILGWLVAFLNLGIAQQPLLELFDALLRIRPENQRLC